MTSRRWALVAAGVAAVVAAVVAVLVLRGDGDGDVAAGPDETPEETTTTTAPPVLAPLTGLPVDPAVLARPALVVKVDNAEGLARPQAGLGQADLVVEEKVEGNISRFFAVYHSTEAPAVGPVRSARSTDISLVAMLADPLFAYSGANDVFQRLLAAAPLVDVGFNAAPDAYERVPDRRAPHNLFTSTAALWQRSPDGAMPPPVLSPWRTPGAPLPTGTLPVGTASWSFGPGGAAVRYEWDAAAGAWVRWQNGTLHVDTDGEPITADNLVVQFVAYVDSGARDTGGNPVPEARTIGEGEALVLLDGVVVAGRWVRPGDQTMTSYLDEAGGDVALRPGRTWVILAPLGTTVDLG